MSLAFSQFELTQALGFGHPHAAELGAPHAKRRVAETAIAAQFLDWKAGLGLFEEPDDLFLAESDLLDVRHSPGG